MSVIITAVINSFKLIPELPLPHSLAVTFLIIAPVFFK